MAEMDDAAPSAGINRVPGLLKGRIVIPDDFDEFTAEDEKLWYGDNDDLMVIVGPFGEEDVDENDAR